MKKTAAASGCSRSKPPPVRNYLSAKSRPQSHHGVERAPFLSPTHHASDRRVSMSEKPEPQGVESIAALRSSPKEVTDCMSSWLTFMQMLKGVCSSGAQLTSSLGQLACQSSACRQRADQLQLMWEQLSHATSAATALVQNQTVAALQEVHLSPDLDADQADINQQVVCSGLLTMINLQYQLSSACCECLSQLAECQCFPPHAEPDCHSVARCFAARLLPAAAATLQPPQRRWSEAAAAAGDKTGAEAAALRRWSMPWKLALPTSTAAAASERSRSTTPETVWHTALASQEELQDVISLLAAKPPPPGGPSTHNLPGVTLTKATGGGPCAGGAISDGSDAIPRPSFSFSHRGSWWGGGTEGDELDIGTLASRKSSSSTDSSSCYSIHSRSSGSASEELTHGQRSHLYSMWSGSDLPFIKLPESSENTES
ncbi:hypothetical protein LSTR_LSTR001787 [Laodelphax striatellus]|uniref:DUF4745 domain-containing protein n=1 Tax=Laodelphax striatellus TaxID=195883 RepID=A0A482WFQ2_LAOST|nr:hypothetical protein LSTR_LSTR001787 [Laodelphax striatellus]